MDSNYFGKDYYFQHKNSNYINYTTRKNKDFWNDIENYVKTNNLKGNYLDVGCAFGYLIATVGNHFQKIYGTDISEYAIEQAKMIYPKGVFIVKDLNKESFDFGIKFDFITALDVLEHTESFENSLSKVKNLLNGEGSLIISMPVNDNPIAKIFCYLDNDKSHVSIKSAKEYESIINKLGLEIVKKRYFLNIVRGKLFGIPVCVQYYLRKRIRIKTF